MSDTKPKLKTILVELTVITGRDNFDTCQDVRQALSSSPLNNTINHLEILQVSVVDESVVGLEC